MGNLYMHDSIQLKEEVSFIISQSAQKLYPSWQTGKKKHFRYSETIVMGKDSQIHNSYTAPPSTYFWRCIPYTRNTHMGDLVLRHGSFRQIVSSF